MAVVDGCPPHPTSFLVVRPLPPDGLPKEAPGTLPPGCPGVVLRFLGTVAAGFPSPAEDALADTMTREAFLLRNTEATYLLKVTEDSRREAGILPGDLLLVERGATPRDGDMGIAQIDRAWTMKYVRRRGRKVFLEAANQAYQPLHPTEELQIAAVVRGVVRKWEEDTGKARVAESQKMLSGFQHVTAWLSCVSIPCTSLPTR